MPPNPRQRRRRNPRRTPICLTSDNRRSARPTRYAYPVGSLAAIAIGQEWGVDEARCLRALAHEPVAARQENSQGDEDKCPHLTFTTSDVEQPPALPAACEGFARPGRHRLVRLDEPAVAPAPPVQVPRRCRNFL